jgi:hypothetical protein
MQLALCGQAPQAITDAALTAINFYVEQQALGGAYTNHRHAQRVPAGAGACRLCAHADVGVLRTAPHPASLCALTCVQAKQKCQQVMQQKNSMYQDNQELQQKYGQKAT